MSAGRATKHSSGTNVQVASGTMNRRRLDGLSREPAVNMPATEPAVPPGSTIPYGQPDTMLDGLEGRVYTTEEVLAEQHQWIVELEQRIEELERERR